MNKLIQKFIDWGNETVHIPGWFMFGLFVFVIPVITIVLGWTLPICQNENQNQCLTNIPNVRIIFSLVGLGFPSIIGVLYLKFRAQMKWIDRQTNREVKE